MTDVLWIDQINAYVTKTIYLSSYLSTHLSVLKDAWAVALISHRTDDRYFIKTMYVYMYIKVYPVFYLYLSSFSSYMDSRSTGFISREVLYQMKLIGPL